jgi:hypothetical protein
MQERPGFPGRFFFALIRALRHILKSLHRPYFVDA